MTERKIVGKSRKNITFFDTPDIHKVSENTSFAFVEFVDLKIFNFKSRKLFGTLCIALKDVIWRFRIYNYFREILDFAILWTL